jgi:hypothetical protein
MDKITPAKEPIREGEGADIVGPRNVDRERQNPFTVMLPPVENERQVGLYTDMGAATPLN